MDWLKDGVGVMQSQAERNPTANEIALRIKKFLIEANPIESDLCGSFLVNVPDLFKCGRGKADKYSGDIVLQITDLLDNVYKLNTSLNAATQYITKSESTEKAVDEVFWIKQNYEQRILQNIDNLVNLYLGR